MTTVTIPTLETERLILRGPLESDFDAHAAFMAGPRSSMVGGPQDRWQAWRGFLGSIGHWGLRGYGFWTMALKQTDEPIGRTGFAMQDGWEEPELGWHVYDAFEGQGYVIEAASAARAAGPDLFGLDSVLSYIAPSNARSRRLAERMGATFERNVTLLDQPAQIWRHPKVGESA